MFSPWLSLSAGSLILPLLASPVTANESSAAAYQLVERWQADNFLEYFNFHVGQDPTNGYVNYLDQASAQDAGLVKVTDSGTLYLGVDHTTKLSPGGKGRDSVRIGTKKYYDQSLVIADIAHMPGSICGSWPAFWSVGMEWPQDGEIDIIEGVNLQEHNEIVMHTSGTCSLTDQGMTGVVNATGCGADLGPVGCVVEGHKGSYGTSFNRQGGGVYAMEWTADFLKIWFFPRRSIPSSISSGQPDVTEFGTPMALVQEGCDVANSFKSQSFVFDVTFCGDWAGGVFGQSGCPMSSSDPVQSCINYVAQNPSAFEQSYWEINSIQIYQTSVNGPASNSTTTHAPATTHTTAEPSVAETQSVTSAHEGATTVHSAVTTSSTEAKPTSVKSMHHETVEKALATTGVKKAPATLYVTNFVTSTKTVCTDTVTANGAEMTKDLSNGENLKPAGSSNTATRVETVVEPQNTAMSTQAHGVNGKSATSNAASNDHSAPGKDSVNSVTLHKPTEIENLSPATSAPGLLPSLRPSRSSVPLIPHPDASTHSPSSSPTGVSAVFTGAAHKATGNVLGAILAFVLALLV
ncbi:hypothetical protein N7474_003573 [Penicillium riverlandense]|uniref:uncharacterized protein n=1 Tax=Penicillium riverlandense TaxID=1903569 RepID=UPI0025476E7A|nr:uncharacterized protein N7474_003573 [Penicillium riverlandense]KAJ5826435.1 hypothetical protein N7474_003573 [Penicillium riverlandense]